MPDAFYKSSFFLNYSTLLYDGDQRQQLSVNCFGVCVSFCVVKIYGHCVHTKHKNVRSAVEVFCSSQGWTRTNTGYVMRYCMDIHFLCFCE